MKTWQAILVAGAMIAAAVIVRFEPIVEVRAQTPELNLSKKEANCIIDNARGIASERMADLVYQACAKIFP